MDVWALDNLIVNKMVVKVDVEKNRVIEKLIEREVMNKSSECYRSVVQFFILHSSYEEGTPHCATGDASPRL
jgi:hypothetical protein